MTAAGLRGAAAHLLAMPRVLVFAHPVWLVASYGLAVVSLVVVAYSASAGPPGLLPATAFAAFLSLPSLAVLTSSRTPAEDVPVLPLGERSRAAVEAAVLLLAVAAGVELLGRVFPAGAAKDRAAWLSFLPLAFATFAGAARHRGVRAHRAGDLQVVLLVAIVAVTALAGSAASRLAGGLLVVVLAFVPEALAARIRVLPRRRAGRLSSLTFREPLPGRARLRRDLRGGVVRVTLPVVLATAGLWGAFVAAVAAGSSDWLTVAAGALAWGVRFGALGHPLGVPVVLRSFDRSLGSLDLLPVSRRSLGRALWLHYALAIVGTGLVDAAFLAWVGARQPVDPFWLKQGVLLGMLQVGEVALVAILVRRWRTGGIGWLGPGLAAVVGLPMLVPASRLGLAAAWWRWVAGQPLRGMLVHGALALCGLGLLAWDLHRLDRRRASSRPPSTRPGAA